MIPKIDPSVNGLSSDHLTNSPLLYTNGNGTDPHKQAARTAIFSLLNGDHPPINHLPI